MRIGGRYALLSRIGQGGMGIVWRAHDEFLGRDVAIKEVMLPSELGEADRDERYARTIREARSAARLSHPGVVTVHDVVVEDGRPWIVMELIAAPSLQGVIDGEGPQPARRVAGIGGQVLAALRAAHAAGIVHRDIKPGNVLVAAADRVVITDFGIAALEGDATLTKSGAMVGSPAYLAPERIRGEPAGPEADLWSLGVTLYAAVEGRSPFERSGAVPTLAAIMGEEPPAPRLAGPLAPVLAGLLRKDPADRTTAAEAARRLGAVAAAAEPATSADPTPAPPPREGGSRPAPHPVAGPPEPVAGPPHAVARPPEPVAGPPHAVARPPEHEPRAGGRPALLVAASALAGALLVAALVLVWVLGRSSGETDRSGDASSTGRRGEATGPAATETGRAGVPAGWTIRHEPGFSVAVPASWERRREGENYYYEDSSTQYMLQVSTAAWNADPMAQAQAQAAGRHLAADFRGFRESSISPVTYRGGQAADIRFAYDRSTGVERAQERFFRLGGHSYMIFFRMPADQWTSRSAGYLDPVFAGFRPA